MQRFWPGSYSAPSGQMRGPPPPGPPPPGPPPAAQASPEAVASPSTTSVGPMSSTSAWRVPPVTWLKRTRTPPIVWSTGRSPTSVTGWPPIDSASTREAPEVTVCPSVQLAVCVASTIADRDARRVAELRARDAGRRRDHAGPDPRGGLRVADRERADRLRRGAALALRRAGPAGRVGDERLAGHLSGDCRPGRAGPAGSRRLRRGRGYGRERGDHRQAAADRQSACTQAGSPRAGVEMRHGGTSRRLGRRERRLTAVAAAPDRCGSLKRSKLPKIAQSRLSGPGPLVPAREGSGLGTAWLR